MTNDHCLSLMLVHSGTGFSYRRYRNEQRTNYWNIYETGSGKIKLRGRVEG